MLSDTTSAEMAFVVLKFSIKMLRKSEFDVSTQPKPDGRDTQVNFLFEFSKFEFSFHSPIAVTISSLQISVCLTIYL